MYQIPHKNPEFKNVFAFVRTENEDKLLWNPHSVTEADAETFLAKSQESLLLQNQQTAATTTTTTQQQQQQQQATSGNQVGMGGLPLGAHVRDDEQALFLLLQVRVS